MFVGGLIIEQELGVGQLVVLEGGDRTHLEGRVAIVAQGNQGLVVDERGADVGTTLPQAAHQTVEEHSHEDTNHNVIGVLLVEGLNLAGSTGDSLASLLSHLLALWAPLGGLAL